MKKTIPPSRGPYINLSQDAMFKAFFKDDEGVLISLLQAFIPLPPERRIQAIRVMDPLLHPLGKDGKQSVMDLKVKTDNKELINVEMQVFPHQHFPKRMLFYWARLHASSLKEGGKYHKINPTVSLIFTLFPVFKGQKDFIRSFSIRDNKFPHDKFCGDLQIILVDLSKFSIKNIDSLLDLQQRWCYLIKQSSMMTEEEARLLAQQGEDMKAAINHLVKLSREESIRELEEARMKQIMDQQAHKDYWVNEGREEGLEEGIQKGQQNLIKNMLSGGAAIEDLAKWSGLSAQEILEIQKNS